MNKYLLKIAASLLAWVALISPHVSAVTFSVNSTVDSTDANPGDGICETIVANECTLRAAIQESNALTGPDIIELSAGTYTLSITGRSEDIAATGDLDISEDLSVMGVDASMTIIDAAKVDRIFHVLDPASLNLFNMTIHNGEVDTDNGGGIRNEGTLKLNKVIVSGNAANPDRGGAGGIFNVGRLDLMDVVISDNTAFLTGGIRNLHNGVATLTNVTISNNTSLAGAAGMENGENIIGLSAVAKLTNVTISGNLGGPFTSSYGGFANGGFRDIATMRNVTITENSAWASGGIRGGATIMNTLVANNIAGSVISGDCSPGIVSLGYNLDSDGTCNLIQPTDLPNSLPLLGPLTDNGGLTETHALLEGSPAIDTGQVNCTDLNDLPLLTDQRGEPRPVDGNIDGFIACDIGSYEVQPPTTIVVSIDILPKLEVNTININNRGSLQVAILSTSDFLVFNEVNPDSVVFGPANAEAIRYKMKDVNRDGLLDILFYFKNRETGIECGDTEAMLTGETFEEIAIEGNDSIVTKGCGQ